MPRKYYAVRSGREGVQIYDSFAKFRRATDGFSGASGSGWDTIEEAISWLGVEPLTFAAPVTIVTNVNLTINLTDGVERSQLETSVSSTTTTPMGIPSRQQASLGNMPLVQTETYPPPCDARQLVEDPGLGRSRPAQSYDVPPPVPPQPEIILSNEQKKILNLVEQGKNIFFTGAAGTGKSVLLREIVNVLEEMYGSVRVARTAPTGVAGLNIGGTTIHSWAGIGLGKESAKRLLDRLSERKRNTWRMTAALIIDEISMLDGRLFDKLDYIGCMVRENLRPFGGIQLILSGDFFQLPPIGEKDSSVSIPPLFAFEAQSWSRCIDHMAELKKVFRQKDNKFIDMLSAMRVGRLTDWHIKEFRKLARSRHYDDGIEPTQLFPRKSEVDACNQQRLRTLPGDAQIFRAMDSYGYDMDDIPIEPRIGEQLLERLVVAKEVALKVGAQVMLLRNQPQEDLVNGSLGKVVEFITVREAHQRHIEMTEMNKGSPARLSSHSGHEFKRNEVFPLVRFTNGIALLCAPTDFTVENLKGGVEARRIQIPLALSYAMSIHKSQGQTLVRVKIDLASVFEKGQAYVALSRATSLEELQVLNFNPSRVAAHHKALQWWVELQNQQSHRHGGNVNEADDPVDDSTSWTILQSVGEQTDGSIDDEMDQDFVVERYFTDTPSEEGQVHTDSIDEMDQDFVVDRPFTDTANEEGEVNTDNTDEMDEDFVIERYFTDTLIEEAEVHLEQRPLADIARQARPHSETGIPWLPLPSPPMTASTAGTMLP